MFFKSENNLLDYQNNYIVCSSMMSNVGKKLRYLIINLSVLYNYFDGSIKLFLDFSN